MQTADIAYTLIRSSRKTLAIEITRDLRVVVRAPNRLAKRDVDDFVRRYAGWIEEHMEKQRTNVDARPEPTEAEERALREQAQAYIPGRVAEYAARMGLTPSGVKITSARTRYGSCSGKNSLCFSFLLMRYPKEAIDYVIVHELAHITHKNHSSAFYGLVEQYMPDYKARRALLKA